MYSAESIITALKSNEELLCEGLDAINCPSPHEGCTCDPDNCDLCLNQRCKQPVTIHRNYKKLVVLNFRFMVSPQNHGGFIRKNDSDLGKLIKHKFIDEKMLCFVRDTSISA
jgi:hypothetical protein